MLILSRKEDESIMIGDNITIKVVSVDKGVVKLGIEAPTDISILRSELIRAVEESNKEAEWYVKFKCKFELEQKALEWIEKKKKILIVGTKDHTAILAKHINVFASVDVVGFSHYKKCYDQKKTSKVPYKTMKIENVTGNDFDEILISSFEYNFEIEQYLKELNIKKPYYSIYDNTSRSFLDIFSDASPQYKAA